MTRHWFAIILCAALLLLGLRLFGQTPVADPAAAARELIAGFKVPPQDGFDLAEQLVTLGPKALPVVEAWLESAENPAAIPYLRQAEGWLLWHNLPPELRDRKAARRTLQGLIACARQARRQEKRSFDHFCRLGSVGMGAALDMIREELKGGDKVARLSYLDFTVQMLADCAGAELVAELMPLLSSAEEVEREAAVFILRGIAQRRGDIRRATPELLRLLHDPLDRVVMNAGQALYFQRDPKILADVFPLLSSKDGLTRAMAGELVEGLTGRDLGFKADAAPEERAQAIERIRAHLIKAGHLPVELSQTAPATQSQPLGVEPEFAGTP